MRPNTFSLIVIALTAVVLAACGGASSGSTDEATGGGSTGSTASGPVDPAAFARPAFLAELPLVALEAPGATGAGPTPVFRWTAVDGAASYRLAVRGPAGQAWAWRGPETSIRYGGVDEGTPGPRLVPGMVWSVAAVGAAGDLVALSELRPVSPTSDPGPVAQTLSGGVGSGSGGTAAGAPSAAPATPDPETVGPCAYLTTDEIAAAMGGEWSAPTLADHIGDTGGCEWTSAKGSLLTIWVLAAEHHDPEGWGATAEVQGLGREGYYVGKGWDRRIGWIHGEFSVMLVVDFKRFDTEKFLGLATLIDQRLP